MPNIIWTILISLLIIISIIGSVLPLVPGPIFAYIALFLYKISPMGEDLNWIWIIFCGGLIVLSLSLDYIIPSVIIKKYNGSKYGIWGALMGTFFGIFIPWGFIFGPFVGAFIGELINDYKDHKKILNASYGAFLSFFIGIGLNLTICGIIIFILLANLLNF